MLCLKEEKGEVNQELRFDQMFQKEAKICDLFDSPIHIHALFFFSDSSDGLRFGEITTERQKRQNQ